MQINLAAVAASESAKPTACGRPAHNHHHYHSVSLPANKLLEPPSSQDRTLASDWPAKLIQFCSSSATAPKTNTREKPIHQLNSSAAASCLELASSSAQPSNCGSGDRPHAQRERREHSTLDDAPATQAKLTLSAPAKSESSLFVQPAWVDSPAPRPVSSRLGSTRLAAWRGTNQN